MDWNVAGQSSPRINLDVFSVTFHKIIRHCIYVIEYKLSEGARADGIFATV